LEIPTPYRIDKVAKHEDEELVRGGRDVEKKVSDHPPDILAYLFALLSDGLFEVEQI